MSQRFAETVCCTPADMERRSERDRLTLFHEGERDGDTREREGRIQSNVINSPRFVRFDYSTPVRMHWHAYSHFSLFGLVVMSLLSFPFFLSFFFPILFLLVSSIGFINRRKRGRCKDYFFQTR